MASQEFHFTPLSRYKIKGLSDASLIINKNAITSKTNNSECEYIAAAIFYEQTNYSIILDLDKAIDARLFSPLANLCDASVWNEKSKQFTINIHTGNDLGDFELCWEWLDAAGGWHAGSLRSQVLSYKLDVQTHFKWMLADVREHFDWLRLDLLRQTFWSWGRDSSQESTLQSWLVVFQEVRLEMTRGFERLTDEHRKRLLPDESRLRADRIRKMNPRIEERIAEGLKDDPDRKYRVESRYLDADTLENRYMKHLLGHCLAVLHTLNERLARIERVSDVFKERLQEWTEDWERLRQHRFWRGIGDFRGLRKESLVLSQDPLYAGIRRNWHWLQDGLALLDQNLKGGIQNAAQLYEIWCLIQLDKYLTANGWKSSRDIRVDFDRVDDDFENTEDLRTGTIKLQYERQVDQGPESPLLDLLYQPTASDKPDREIWGGMMSLPVNQRPDLVLRLTRRDLPDQPVYTWIFDAKYRLGKDGAPDDAINTMHRYRDAILWSAESSGKGPLTRESLGAFVLYPGKDSVDQIGSVQRVNIGAFPLLPKDPAVASLAMAGTKLEEQLGKLLDIPKRHDLGSVHDHFAAVPLVRRPGKAPIPSMVIANVVAPADLNADYWRECRLYCLPVELAEGIEIPVEHWGWLAPGGGKYGMYKITQREKMQHDRIVAVYNSMGIPMGPSSANSPLKAYWLFWLNRPEYFDFEIEKLPEGQYVKVFERQASLMVEDRSDWNSP